jgi:acyl-coenzyme A thioesterase PaaI-like protein
MDCPKKLNLMNEKSLVYRKQALNALLFRFSMLKRLPSVAFWGIKIKTLEEDRCQVLIPFTWRTQNPFGSIYFGALLGAAELSTGALCQMLIKGRGDYSMLVVGFSATFIKKATTTITFSCNQGVELAKILDGMTQKGDTGTFEMTAVGTNTNGEVVGNAIINWSFKRR